MVISIPQNGDLRIKRKFAFFKVGINERSQVWLQFYWELQRYTVKHAFTGWAREQVYLTEDTAKVALKNMTTAEHHKKNKYAY